MKQRLILTAAFVLALSGCSGDPSAAPAAPSNTGSASVAATSPAAAAELIIPVNGSTPATTQDDRDHKNQVVGLVPANLDVIRSAYNMCGAFEQGRSAQYVLDSFVDFGLTKIAAMQFVGSATITYCEYYESFLPDGPNEYTPS